MIRTILIILYTAISLCSYSQIDDIGTYEEIYFEGYINDNAVFTDERNFVYQLSENNTVGMKFLDSGRLSFFPPKYVGLVEIDGLSRRYVETFKLPLKVIISTPQKTYIQEANFDSDGITTDFSDLKVYFGDQTDNPDRHEVLPIKQLDLETGKLTELPIRGVYPKVINEYMFYADYPNPDQYDLVYDIYRVKIGDWENPEKIFENNYMNGWTVSDDGKYLLVENIESGYSPKKIIYNIQQKKYSLIANDGHLPEPVFYSKNKNAFCFYDISLRNGQRRFMYVNIPDQFPDTPAWAMSFGNSFITNYWLDEASEQDLNRLSKDELRLLRNAVFARKGWQFQSDDLNDFFNQFDWYQEKKGKYSSNDEIKLTNSDKFRSQLILNVESQK